MNGDGGGRCVGGRRGVKWAIEVSGSVGGEGRVNVTTVRWPIRHLQ